MTIFLASLCKTHFKHLEIWLNYLKIVFYSRFCTKCDEFPVNLKFTNCLCKRYKFRKHVYFPISNFHALKECLVRKEKYALPPYCKGVSKKQTLKDSFSLLDEFYCRNGRTFKCLHYKRLHCKTEDIRPKAFSV